MAHRLYAALRNGSAYACDNEMARTNPTKWGLPFAVSIRPANGDYAVEGGPGGRYRLADVYLYVIEDGIELQIA